MDFHSTCIIWNPASAGGRARKRWYALEKALLRRNYPFKASKTEYPGHAIRLARDAIEEGYLRLAAFGGDGTLHEVVQGMMSNDHMAHPDLNLSFLPAGSSCDFAKLLPPRSCIERLCSSRSFLMDLIRIECRCIGDSTKISYAVNSSSIGIISMASKRINYRSRLTNLAKRFSIDACSILAGAEAIMIIKPILCDIYLDDNRLNDLFISNLTVFKNPWIAGKMKFGEAELAEGKMLNLALLKTESKARTLGLFFHLYHGTIFQSSMVSHYTCQTVEVKTNRQQTVEADGELIGFTAARYTLLPDAIRIVI